MKRIIALVLLICIVCTLLCACGKKECAFCGEEKKCKTKEVNGVSYNYCADCEGFFNTLKKSFEGLFDEK